ncbi:LysR substrate-binding domain-containing protein [Sinomonas sp. G460-2]|uniref:LysR substrate-binding domain-containing protein n=1 Tax=Sinomonas sp. G460-2 TaxID=3393464 RepID=UPI0039EDFE1F
MDFRELEVFRAVAEDLHFGRAAERLYVTQSAVSQQLRRLEDELGLLLFHRTSRTVRLTPAGTALLAEVRKIFAARDHAIQVAQQAAAGERGRLSIAANYPASRLLLLPLIERLRASHPSLTLIPRELPSSEQMAELLRGELDVGLAYGPIANASLCSAKLLEVPVVAVVRSSHPLAGSGVLGLSDLPRHRYITAHAGATSAIEDSLMARAAVAGIRLRRSPSATDLSGYLLELETSDTIGFSSLPRGEQSRANGMHVLRLEPEPLLELHAVWAVQRHDSLVNSVLNELRDLATAPEPGR